MGSGVGPGRGLGEVRQRQAGPVDQCRALGVLEHGRHAADGKGRVDRQVHGPGVQQAVEELELFDAALDAEPDDVARGHTGGGEPLGDLTGRADQLGVGSLSTPEATRGTVGGSFAQGTCLRGALGLLLESLEKRSSLDLVLRG